MADVNGDGVFDFSYASTMPDGTPVVITTLGNPNTFRGLPATWTPGGVRTRTLPSNPNGGYIFAAEEDLNGDGLADHVFDEDPTRPNQIFYPSALSFGTPTSFSDPLSFDQFGGPVDSAARPYSIRYWMDVNGDGLPDLFTGTIVGDEATPGSGGSLQGTIYLNMGGPWQVNANTGATPAPMFKAISIPAVPTPPGVNSMTKAFAMDVDGDGEQELLVPYARVQDYCGGTDPLTMLPSGEPAFWCGDEFDSAPVNYRSLDLSVFTWDVYKLVEHKDGSYTFELQPYSPSASGSLGLLASVDKLAIKPGDMTGDGMADVEYMLKPNTSNGYFRDTGTQARLSNAQLGHYLSYNVAGAPDLMTGATNGLGAQASWSLRPLVYSPLTLGLSPPSMVVGSTGTCTPPADGSPFYGLTGAPHSSGYQFFTSSMWNVASFSQSSGVMGTLDPGLIKNLTCYQYQDAMASSWGRGFQGFRVITSREQFAPTNGVDQNRTTRTEFHQEFPLIGRVKTTTVSQTNGRPISETDTWWHQLQAPDAPGAWVVYASATSETLYDPAAPAGPHLSDKISIVQVDPATGNALDQWTYIPNATVVQGSGGTVTGANVVSLERVSYFAADKSANWILDEVQERDTDTGFWSGTSPLANLPPEAENTSCQSMVWA